MPTLVVFDASAVYRAGLTSLLTKTCFKTVREAAGVHELDSPRDEAGGPPIVLMGSRRSEDTILLISKIMARAPGARIVVLAPELDADFLAECFARGISGFLLEEISPAALEESLKLVCVGEKTFPSGLAHMISDLTSRLRCLPNGGAGVSNAVSPFNLSPRDIEILECLTEGKSNKEIAQMLGLSEATVKLDLRRILRSIHASNRTQAAMWLMQKKFEVEPDQRGRLAPGIEPPAEPAENNGLDVAVGRYSHGNLLNDEVS